MSGCNQGDVADDMAVLRKTFEMLTAPPIALEREKDISKHVEEQSPSGPTCCRLSMLST